MTFYDQIVKSRKEVKEVVYDIFTTTVKLTERQYIRAKHC